MVLTNIIMVKMSFISYDKDNQAAFVQDWGFGDIQIYTVAKLLSLLDVKTAYTFLNNSKITNYIWLVVFYLEKTMKEKYITHEQMAQEIEEDKLKS